MTRTFFFFPLFFHKEIAPIRSLKKSLFWWRTIFSGSNFAVGNRGARNWAREKKYWLQFQRLSFCSLRNNIFLVRMFNSETLADFCAIQRGKNYKAQETALKTEKTVAEIKRFNRLKGFCSRASMSSKMKNHTCDHCSKTYASKKKLGFTH